LASIRRAREKAKRKFLGDQHKAAEKIIREVNIPDVITVQELSNRMAEKTADVIKALMKLGLIVTINQVIDADTAELVVTEFGHKVKRVTEHEIETALLQKVEDKLEDLKSRPPVVTVMGHVDHGKTSLLDALRQTDVVAGEAGGITQHIGAYQVTLKDGKLITFLDTPGHEAFTAMRMRGAKVTDIVVLVVAADDGIMQQSIEAINHARAANVPIIVAINKIDKPEANPERVKNDLLSQGLVPESMGGDIMVIEVSAKSKINLDKLEEAILLQAEMLELKASTKRFAEGAVIEAKVDKGRGIVATLLVQRGTLKIGDIVIAGSAWGKIRALINDKGQNINEALPATPVEVLGLEHAPIAGDEFAVVQNEKTARDLVTLRLEREKQKKLIATKAVSLEQLFINAGTDGVKELPVVIKADVQGSVEAIANSLLKLNNQEINVRILHSAVGGITESDVILAGASHAIIIGFNVRPNQQARDLAKQSSVDIRYYSIIYNLVDDVKAAMGGMLSPSIKENVVGYAEIRQVFDLSKFGKIAGCYVVEGMIKRGVMARIVRDSVVVYAGKLKALKRFKDDVKEVNSGFECGMSFENYDDIKVGDRIEAYELTEEARTM
jgi:translation initiation factor IF-2